MEAKRTLDSGKIVIKNILFNLSDEDQTKYAVVSDLESNKIEHRPVNTLAEALAYDAASAPEFFGFARAA